MILLFKASEADYAKRYRNLLARRTDGSQEAMAREDARLAALASGSGPSPAQAEAGNYRKKHIRFQGLAIAIENPKGSVRRGKDRGGHKWAVKMQADYGYVNGSMGVDGDAVDCYIGPDKEAGTAYIVTTMAPPDFARRDENKCMLGYASEAAAKAAFLAHYDNPKFFGGILAMPMDEFKAKVLATKDAPKFIKGMAMGANNSPMILFIKARVGPYMRNGKMVNLTGYHGRDKKAAPPPGQMALFPAPEKKPMGPSRFSEDHMKHPEKHTPDMFDGSGQNRIPSGWTEADASAQADYDKHLKYGKDDKTKIVYARKIVVGEKTYSCQIRYDENGFSGVVGVAGLSSKGRATAEEAASDVEEYVASLGKKSM